MVNKISTQLEIMPDERIMVEVLKSFTTIEEIEALEGEMLALGAKHVPVQHHFCKGVYTRQIMMPKGFLAIGDLHTDECINIVPSGSVSVIIGGEVRRITGPCQFASHPGERKIGFIHDDLTWITVHACDTNNVDEAEAKTIIKSETFKKYRLEKGDNSTQIANCQTDDFWDDRLDYFSLIKEMGLTHVQVKEMSDRKDNHIEFPEGTGGLVFIGSSAIQGNGLFSKFPLTKNTIICPATVGKKRTHAGRYVNHSHRPNCRFDVDKNGDLNLISLINIPSGIELTVDYRQAQSEARKADVIMNSIIK